MTDWKAQRDAAADDHVVRALLKPGGTNGYYAEKGFQAGADWAREQAQAEIAALRQAAEELARALEELQKELVPWTGSRDGWDDSDDWCEVFALKVENAINKYRAKFGSG
jgi:hypothetical protein